MKKAYMFVDNIIGAVIEFFYFTTHRMLLRIAVWIIKGKVAYLERLATSSALNRADVNYMGKSADYWMGFAEGIDASIKIITEHYEKENRRESQVTD